MPEPKRLTTKDLAVGGRYLHVNRLFIRTFDAIEGDAVIYHDQHGQGRCGRSAFLKACPAFASGEQTAQAEEHLARITRKTEGEITLRDEANALTAFAFRNGFLEDLHAGKHSQILDQPGYSRISDEEIKRLMIEASQKLEKMLAMKREQPAECAHFIRDYQRKYCPAWKRG
jgi:thiamine monophosphate kinase